MRLRDLSPRCGGPVIPYERPGRVFPEKYDDVPAMIRSAREALGMSQAALAALVDVNGSSAVSKWELGQTYPARAAAALERVLGIRLPGPRCGRPEGHRGACRSAAAVVRYLEQAASERLAARETFARESSPLTAAGRAAA